MRLQNFLHPRHFRTSFFMILLIMLIIPSISRAQVNVEIFASVDGLEGLYDLEFTPNGNLSVSGEDSQNIVLFDPFGDFLGTLLSLDAPARGIAFGVPNGLWGSSEPDGNLNGFVFFIDSVGEVTVVSNSPLLDPRGMTRGPNGNIFVAERGSGSILQFDVVSLEFATFVSPDDDGCDDVSFPAFSPLDGNLFVTCRGSGEVYRYDTGGEFVLKWSTSTLPSGIAIDIEGRVYVARENSNDVSRYESDGEFIDTFAQGVVSPRGMVFGPDGDLYIADSGTNAIMRAQGDVETTGVCAIAGKKATVGGLFINLAIILLPALLLCVRFTLKKFHNHPFPS